MWPSIICHVHFICFWYSRGLSCQSLHRAPLTSPGNRKTKSKLSNLCKKMKKDKSELERQRSERLTMFDRAHRKKGRLVSRAPEKCIRTDLGSGGNWWPYFSVCSSKSVSVWVQNRWTGTQIWNLISGHNDAVHPCSCECVCVLPSLPSHPSLFSICTAPTYFFNWTFRTSFSLRKQTQNSL